MNLKKFEDIRKQQYHLTEKFAYLDTSTTGLISKNSKSAIDDYIDDRYNNAMNSLGVVESWDYADSFRKTVAKMFNAESEEIFFGANCSDMFNLFVGGIETKDGANVVVSGLTFPSTPYSWANKIGEQNVRIAPAENGQVKAESLFELCDQNTVAISLCLVENTSGFRHDIETISRFCEQKGIYLVLDITQCIGAIEIDVKKTPIDFITTSSYKWLGGVFGVGFSYISNKILADVSPTHVGWVGNKQRFKHRPLKFDLSDTAEKFECGNLNWLGLKGIEQSIKIYLDLGKSDVESYILSLTDYLLEKAETTENVGVVGPFDPKNRSGISFVTYPSTFELTNQKLEENGIRAHCTSDTSMRVALHFYNNKSDVDKLFEFLNSLN